MKTEPEIRERIRHIERVLRKMDNEGVLACELSENDLLGEELTTLRWALGG